MKLFLVGWDGKVTYYMFAFEVPIAQKDERCGMFRATEQMPSAR